MRLLHVRLAQFDRMTTAQNSVRYQHFNLPFERRMVIELKNHCEMFNEEMKK